jgi:hypothetical protein
MSIASTIHDIEAMGFELEVDGEVLYVCPFSELDSVRLEWLRTNKPLVREYLVKRRQFQRVCMGAVALGRAGLWD